MNPSHFFLVGYFHAYDVGSIVSGLDFWVHTGDYIYEYGNYSTYARDSPERGALLDPKWEIVDCQDYRNRYAQYRRDEALQTLHRVAPLSTLSLDMLDSMRSSFAHIVYCFCFFEPPTIKFLLGMITNTRTMCMVWELKPTPVPKIINLSAPPL